MKKVLLLIFAIAFIANIGLAQNDWSNQRKNLQIGIKAGANLSNVYDTKGDEFYADPKFGFVAGAFLGIPIGKLFGFQPEFLFSQKGFKGKIANIEFKRTTNHIDVPLLIQFKPAAQLTLLAGPMFSYLLKQKDEFANSSLEQEFNTDNIRKNTFCFTGGIDININSIVVSARAGWDIQTNNGDGTSYDPRYKNVWYQATFGIRF